MPIDYRNIIRITKKSAVFFSIKRSEMVHMKHIETER